MKNEESLVRCKNMCQQMTVGILLFFVCGCGGLGQSAADAGDEDIQVIEGLWVGKWFCEKTGHSGPMRCRLTRIKEGQYLARYDGFFAGFIPFWYSVKKEVTRGDGVVYMKAEENLGWYGGGLFKYEGEIRDGEYHMRYDSKYYAGTFELSKAYHSERRSVK